MKAAEAHTLRTKACWSKKIKMDAKIVRIKERNDSNEEGEKLENGRLDSAKMKMESLETRMTNTRSFTIN